jgi:hypothetical protein
MSNKSPNLEHVTGFKIDGCIPEFIIDNVTDLNILHAFKVCSTVLKLLSNAKGGAMLLDLRVSSSVQADVISLLSPTVNGMQTLRDGPFNFRGGATF